LAFDPSGGPFVAWHESDGTAYDVYVRDWNGSAWNSVGSGLSANGGSTDAQQPSLALDGSGNPVVAWHETDGTVSNIYARRWDGRAWSPVGGGLSANGGSTPAGDASLALDGSGNPVVAWHETDGTAYNIYVQR
jgi:hypothetical protein